ncbi:MAG: hypothetical protein Q8807_03850 ['Waltheria sp.' little leaf phytoplasma]|nr:hypothetical protein ['Waltheria sp.' little leaf phytoplasma]
MFQNSNVFELDHMPATSEEPDLSRDGADNKILSPQTQLLIHEEEQVPLKDLSGDHIDESWTQYLVEEDQVYPSTSSNQRQIVENEGCGLLFSKKRSRSEDVGTVNVAHSP